MDITDIKPFENCPALDGYHCQTNSLAKIYTHYGHPLSEDMMLGLGAGMGFIYWKMSMGQDSYVFIGGRANNKDFFSDLGRRTGVKISVISTSSAGKAEKALIDKMKEKRPVMMFGDMGFLPWFKDLPADYHFGGHTFVICGFDGSNTVLASDMEQRPGGLKKGFYFPVTLEQLRKARSSTFKPFPPRNTYLGFDFSNFYEPDARDIFSAIRQTTDSLLNPPIKNLGVKGLRHASKELLKWPDMFNDHDLRMNLFNIYIFVETGGTGGGCFRYMYSRFLKEAAEITKNKDLLSASRKIEKSGGLFSDAGLLFKEIIKATDVNERIKKASVLFSSIADLEEEIFNELSVKLTA